MRYRVLLCLVLLLCACGKEPVRAHITKPGIVWTSAEIKGAHSVCLLQDGAPVDVLSKMAVTVGDGKIDYFEIQDPLDEKCRGWVPEYSIRFD